DLSGIPVFNRAVLEVTRAIDPGRTLTYGQVAHRIGQPGGAQAGRRVGWGPRPAPAASPPRPLALFAPPRAPRHKAAASKLRPRSRPTQ
ncbi:MGMT family protein, partial [Nocardia brasiliensis]|uniref:MGMT family protein n=1 Tax=Nocardia brasiliensis TaxID=37326 RepID=UPI00245408DE